MSIDRARETAINRKLRELKQETILVVWIKEKLQYSKETIESFNTILESEIPKFNNNTDYLTLENNLYNYLKELSALVGRELDAYCILNIFKY